MSLTGAIAKHTLIQIIGKAVGLAATVATVALMTRALGPIGYGEYVTAFAFLQVVFITVDFGLQMTAATMLSDPKTDAPAVLGNLVSLRVLTAGAAAVVGGGLLWMMPFPLAVKIGGSILTVSFVAADAVAVLTGLFQYRLTMTPVALAEVASKVLLLAGVAVAVWNGLGLLGIMAVTAGASLVQAIALLYIARKIFPFRWRVDWPVWRKIFQTTWPLAVTIALNLVYFKMDTVILSLTRGSNEVGLYGAPYRILELGIHLGYLFLGLILPLLSRAAATNDQPRFTRLLQRGFDGMAVAAVPFVVGGGLISQPLMVLVAGESFAAAAPLLAILLLATGIIFLAAVFGYAVVSLGAQRRLIPWYAANAVVSLAAYGWLIPRFGALAAAWLTVGSELVILIAAAVVTYQQTRQLPRLRVAALALVSAIPMAGAVLLTPTWPVISRVALGGLAYLITLRALGGLPRGLPRQIIHLETGNGF